MSYVCLDCGHAFNVPREYREKHGLEGPPYEWIQCCPLCGGSFEPSVECDLCGRDVAESEVKELLGAYLCEECFKNEGGDTDVD